MTAIAPSPPESFAMLPDSVETVPSSRGVPALTEPVPALTVGYVSSGSMQVPAASNNPEVDRLISTYAANYDVPEALVRRVVKRESNFRPGARNGPYYGLMQILPATARSMGFSGSASGLLDAETNLKYAVKYLKGAFLVAGGDHDQAVRNYARGYYYEAKRKGMLGVMDGMLVKRTRMPEGTAVASAAAMRTPVQNLASQWETGFVTATAARPTAAKSPDTLAARMGSSTPQAVSVSAPAQTSIGFTSVGAASTPSLGVSVSGE